MPLVPFITEKDPQDWIRYVGKNLEDLTSNGILCIPNIYLREDGPLTDPLSQPNTKGRKGEPWQAQPTQPKQVTTAPKRKAAAAAAAAPAGKVRPAGKPPSKPKDMTRPKALAARTKASHAVQKVQAALPSKSVVRASSNGADPAERAATATSQTREPSPEGEPTGSSPISAPQTPMAAAQGAKRSPKGTHSSTPKGTPKSTPKTASKSSTVPKRPRGGGQAALHQSGGVRANEGGSPSLVEGRAKGLPDPPGGTRAVADEKARLLAIFKEFAEKGKIRTDLLPALLKETLRGSVSHDKGKPTHPSAAPMLPPLFPFISLLAWMAY